jgi:CRP/FNR family transcriptional regulator
MPDPAALDALPLFASLSAATRRRLASSAVERAYEPGATLFYAGTEPAGIYIVLSGRVRVVRSRDGRQYVVHNEGPGGTLAEVPFFEQGLLPATAVAIEPTRCFVLNRDMLRATMRDDPALAWLFLQRLSSRVRELVQRLDRAATQAELAEELGTVREVLVRGLAQLRGTGVIASAGRGRYVVKDLPALEKLAES